MKSFCVILVFTLIQLFLISKPNAQADIVNYEQKQPNMRQAHYCKYEDSLDRFSRVYSINKYNQIDRIVVSKKYKKLFLISNGRVYKSYDVAFGPMYKFGHKEFEGDNKTPEGLYYIDFKNPGSSYYKSLHVSYPNQDDIDYATHFIMKPGGNVMIHGYPNASLAEFKGMDVPAIHPNIDWTQGCIAVTNTEIDEIYKLVTAPLVGVKKKIVIKISD